MKERIQWIDTAKGIGIICVILGHLYAPGLFIFIYSFHIPLFFFLSGYLFNGKSCFKEFVKSKIKGLLIPYIVLGVPLLVLSTIYESKGFSIDVFFEYCKKFILQQRLYTLWFLTSLFVLEILFYFINKYIKNACFQILIAILLCTQIGRAHV